MAWYDVADQDLTEGLHAVTLEDGRRLVLVRRGIEWWALRDVCPHQGAPLSAGVVQDPVIPCKPGQPLELSCDEPVVVCPWHGWSFALADGQSRHGSTARVRTYPTRILDGRVWVDA